MRKVKRLLKLLMAKTPYRIVRDRGANRFQAIEPCLSNMKARGFFPRVVIDGGAHVGSFSLATKRIFPDALFHLIEPQPACRKSLEKLCAERHNFVFHECALAEKEGYLNLARTTEASTGAYITLDPANAVPVRASTLDSLFGSITHDDRTLLKLDLQGYEMHALQGGSNVLRQIEVILIEVSFYVQSYEPKCGTLLSFLHENDYELYDIAALSGRARDNRLHQGDFVFVRAGSQLLQDNRWE